MCRCPATMAADDGFAVGGKQERVEYAVVADAFDEFGIGAVAVDFVVERMGRKGGGVASGDAHIVVHV